MAIIGGQINPAYYPQPDYSGAVQSAQMQAREMANLGASIGGAIKDFGEVRQERKKIDAETKASRLGIESAIKLGKSLGFDVEGTLSPVLSKMDDPNTTPVEAAALGREASSQIANVLNLGFKAQDQMLEKARLSQDAAYKTEQLKISLQNANSRAKTAIAAGGSAPSTIDMPLGDGSTQKVQWDKEKQSYIPIQVSGLGEISTSSLSNLPDPLKPFGKDFETAGAKYGVDPKLLAAIAMHETGNGTSSAFRNKNNAMGVSDASGPIQMNSVSDSIERMAMLLGKGINEGTGPYANAKSIEDIANIYAPPGAGNDPKDLNKFWTSGVTSNIQKLTKDQPKIGYTPAKKQATSRIVTGEEAKQLGGDPEKEYIVVNEGESTTRISPSSSDIIERNTKANEQARSLYEQGDRLGALNVLRALRAKDIYGDITDQTLDEYFGKNSSNAPTSEIPAAGFDSLNPEEKRAYLNSLTPEKRQELLNQRLNPK